MPARMRLRIVFSLTRNKSAACNRQMRRISNLRENQGHKFEELLDASEVPVEVDKHPRRTSRIGRRSLERRRLHNP